MRQLPAGGGEAAGDGGSGGPEEAAGHGGETRLRVCVFFNFNTQLNLARSGQMNTTD